LLRLVAGRTSVPRFYWARRTRSAFVDFILLQSGVAPFGRFSLESPPIADRIAGAHPSKEPARADRILGRTLIDFAFAELVPYFAGRFHRSDWRGGADVRQVSLAVQEQYSLGTGPTLDKRYSRNFNTKPIQVIQSPSWNRRAKITHGAGRNANKAPLLTSGRPIPPTKRSLSDGFGNRVTRSIAWAHQVCTILAAESSETFPILVRVRGD